MKYLIRIPSLLNPRFLFQNTLAENLPCLSEVRKNEKNDFIVDKEELEAMEQALKNIKENPSQLAEFTYQELYSCLNETITLSDIPSDQREQAYNFLCETLGLSGESLRNLSKTSGQKKVQYEQIRFLSMNIESVTVKPLMGDELEAQKFYEKHKGDFFNDKLDFNPEKLYKKSKEFRRKLFALMLEAEGPSMVMSNYHALFIIFADDEAGLVNLTKDCLDDPRLGDIENIAFPITAIVQQIKSAEILSHMIPKVMTSERPDNYWRAYNDFPDLQTKVLQLTISIIPKLITDPNLDSAFVLNRLEIIKKYPDVLTAVLDELEPYFLSQNPSKFVPYIEMYLAHPKQLETLLKEYNKTVDDINTYKSLVPLFVHFQVFDPKNKHARFDEDHAVKNTLIAIEKKIFDSIDNADDFRTFVDLLRLDAYRSGDEKKVEYIIQNQTVNLDTFLALRNGKYQFELKSQISNEDITKKIQALLESATSLSLEDLKKLNVYVPTYNKPTQLLDVYSSQYVSRFWDGNNPECIPGPDIISDKDLSIALSNLNKGFPAEKPFTKDQWSKIILDRVKKSPTLYDESGNMTWLFKLHSGRQNLRTHNLSEGFWAQSMFDDTYEKTKHLWYLQESIKNLAPNDSVYGLDKKYLEYEKIQTLGLIQDEWIDPGLEVIYPSETHKDQLKMLIAENLYERKLACNEQNVNHVQQIMIETLEKNGEKFLFKNRHLDVVVHDETWAKKPKHRRLENYNVKGEVTLVSRFFPPALERRLKQENLASFAMYSSMDTGGLDSSQMAELFLELVSTKKEAQTLFFTGHGFSDALYTHGGDAKDEFGSESSYSISAEGFAQSWLKRYNEPPPIEAEPPIFVFEACFAANFRENVYNYIDSHNPNYPKPQIITMAEYEMPGYSDSVLLSRKHGGTRIDNALRTLQDNRSWHLTNSWFERSVLGLDHFSPFKTVRFKNIWENEYKGLNWGEASNPTITLLGSDEKIVYL